MAEGKKTRVEELEEKGRASTEPQSLWVRTEKDWCLPGGRSDEKVSMFINHFKMRFSY